MEILYSILLVIGYQILALFIALGLALGVPLLLRVASKSPTQQPLNCPQRDRRQGIDPQSARVW